MKDQNVAENKIIILIIIVLVAVIITIKLSSFKENKKQKKSFKNNRLFEDHKLQEGQSKSLRPLVYSLQALEPHIIQTVI